MKDKRKRQSTTLRRKQIIKAAGKVVVRYGSENVTIKRIAAEVGITEGTIYRHFTSKKEVLSGLADYTIDDLLRNVSKNNSQAKANLANTEKILKKHVTGIEKNKGASFQVIAEILSFGDKELNRKIYSGLERYVLRLEGLLAFGSVLKKTSTKYSTHQNAFVLFSIIKGMVDTWVLSNYSFNLKEKYSELWGVFHKLVNE